MKAKKHIYRGIECDSTEEKLFLMWLFEFYDLGLVKVITRAPTYLLSEPLISTTTEEIQLKTKIKTVVKTKTVLHGHVYTPEFIIYPKYDDTVLASCFNGTFHEGHLVYLIEVKPEFDAHNMTRLNQINRKWLYKDQGVFVNLVKPQELFRATFYPKEYTGKKKTNNLTINDWLSERLS